MVLVGWFMQTVRSLIQIWTIDDLLCLWNFQQKIIGNWWAGEWSIGDLRFC